MPRLDKVVFPNRYLFRTLCCAANSLSAQSYSTQAITKDSPFGGYTFMLRAKAIRISMSI